MIENKNGGLDVYDKENIKADASCVASNRYASSGM